MKREIVVAARAIVKDGLSLARKPVTSKRFQTAVTKAGGNAKIAVGAGEVTLPGWLNTDISWRAAYYLDLSKPWPVPANSINRVYADNVIEHFPLPLARQALTHIFSALAPGGRIRLSTPDVERTAIAYLENGDLAARHLERHRKHGYDVYHPVDLLRITFTAAEHYLGYCFDYASLAAEMYTVGFRDIRREEAGVSSDPEFAQLEARSSDTERATELVIEGVKPG